MLIVTSNCSDISKVRKANLPKSQAATAAGAGDGGEEGCTWAPLGLAQRSHISSSLLPPSSSPREEAMQMETRNKYSCLLCATADVFQNVWLGPRNQAHPGKEALSRRKRGKGWHICQYLSAFWGAEHTAQTWQPR